jgi:hyperosmotically inducible protein
MKGMLSKVFVAAVFALGIAGAATTSTATPSSDAEIAKRLVHEIRMYSRYTIWDNVSFRVQDGRVEILGEVSQPFKKEDINRLAKSVPGVGSVTNDLKVLPLSPMDDRIRLQVARAIYGNSALSRYGMQPLAPIHIVVENGHVTLEGVVANDMDKQIAGIQAASAGLSFGPVVNNLQVENSKTKKG